VRLVCELLAAGKTTYARQLAAQFPAARFTLDKWMIRLYGLRYDDPTYVARLEACQRPAPEPRSLNSSARAVRGDCGPGTA
jgi:predicted kinase